MREERVLYSLHQQVGIYSPCVISDIVGGHVYLLSFFSTVFLLVFEIVPTVWYFFVFHFIISLLVYQIELLIV